MSERLWVVSKSHLDVRLTLAAFETRPGYNSVNVLVIGNSATVKPLREAGIPESSITLVPLGSETLRMRRIVSYVRSLRREKQLVDKLIGELRGTRDTDVLFFSYHMSPHVGYFISEVSKTHKVMFLDAIAAVPKPLSLLQKPRRTYLSGIVHYAAVSAVFGRIFGVSGTAAYPYVYLKPSKCRVIPCPQPLRDLLAGARKVLHEVSAGERRNAVVLYGDPFMCEPALWRSIYRMAFETLLEAGFNVLVKVHPNSSLPDFIDSTKVTFLPQHLPFELIRFRELSLIVGIDGGAMVDKVDTTTISLVKMIYPEASPFRGNISYLKQNPALRLPENEASFRKMLYEIELTNG